MREKETEKEREGASECVCVCVEILSKISSFLLVTQCVLKWSNER